MVALLFGGGFVPLETMTLSPATAAEVDAAEGMARPARRPTEVGILPAFNYNSDLGLGVGALASLAGFSPNTRPYAWRLQILAYATLRDDGRGIHAPYHDDYVRFDVPRLLGSPLRLSGEVAFRKFSNAAYHGFGNRSRRAEAGDLGFLTDEAARAHHVYDRIYPSASLRLRYPLFTSPSPQEDLRIELFGGTQLVLNDFTIGEGTALARDIELSRTPGPDGDTLRGLLRGTDDHLLWVLCGGLLFDTRDQELAPSKGTLTELSVRVSPGVEAGLVFAGVTASTALFFPLLGKRLVLATRLAFDALTGAVPFYELSRFGGFEPSEAPGGGWAVRGVLRQRYAGKVKVLSNLELRAQLFPFQLLGQRFELGMSTFADAGRVFADFAPLKLRGAPLDGPFHELAVGLGGGLRLRWGETLLIRADLAYAPTEGTSGFYLDIGHLF